MSKDIFDSLSSLTPRLDEASRKANDILKTAKKRLAEVALGMEAFVVLESDGNPQEGESCCETLLRYARRYSTKRGPEVGAHDEKERPQRWDLWVDFVETDSNNCLVEFDGHYPVLECRREIRIKAARAIPKLVRALKNAAEETISELDQALKSISSDPKKSAPSGKVEATKPAEVDEFDAPPKEDDIPF